MVDIGSREEDEWNERIRTRIHEREQVEWRTECLLSPKLRTYVKLKRELRTEPFLQSYHRGGIPELVKVRGGSNRLRIEQGRYVKERVEERLCVFCESKQVEDEEHFMLDCEAYKDLRARLWKKCEEATSRSKASFPSREQQLNVLIGDELQPEDEEEKSTTKSKSYRELSRAVMEYITSAMNKRRGLQKVLDGVKSARADAVHLAGTGL